MVYFLRKSGERRLLLAWFDRSKRDLPWRNTRDPYRIWVSEVMLQQTRVAAVIPYYQRFLERFPDVQALAEAPEAELLALWSGLGYYSRARNLRKAARAIAARGEFPSDYDAIRALPGVGDYTAAAVASIAFGLPHAVADGNVRRVLARLTRGEGDVRALAEELLDRRRPGDFNQALMELGATVCLPRGPKCGQCPLGDICRARAAGEAERYPRKARRAETVRVDQRLLLIRRGDRLLLRLRTEDSRQLAGFWELPEASDLPAASQNQQRGSFRHAIVHYDYRVTVWEAAMARKPKGFRWISPRELAGLPLTTATRKALLLAGFQL
ncbi:MAG: A/G-specific adenine glycosylase [Acidobacteria bacterium]|nr:A/G-specific adenine glycosylase [Acidobacteriota bacterium]